MSQPAKGQEPSMDEILASIRRIIADDDPGQMPPKGSEAEFSPPARPATLHPDVGRAATMRASASPPPERATREDEIDSMLAQLQAGTRPAPPEEDPGPGVGRVAAEPTHFPTSDDRPDLSFEDSLPEPPAPRPAGERRSAPDVSERGLLTGATASAVDSAFNALAHTVQVRNGRTLEDFVSELLRPMLKTWLDENLPAMVERLVRAEIERVSRGRG
jgi:cell pole-organizing protein PopZ